jgi:aerotolerance regulator-like protein/VWA domain-containing protein
MLSFLSPLFLVGAAAAAVPILLHLLRREPEPRVPFTAVRFLKQAPVEQTKRRRLRELLLLALRVAALVLLAVAFARPFTPAAAGSVARGLMIVLDTSASMSVPGIMERARDMAAAAVRRASAGDLVGVMTFSDRPQLVAPLSADRGPAQAAISSAAPGFGATRYRSAFDAAVRELAGHGGTVLVVTDLQETGWDGGPNLSIPESLAVEIADVGPPQANLAVTSIRATAERVVASVRNDGDEPRETRAHLVLDSKPAADVVVAVGPRAFVDVQFGVPSRAETAAVTIDDLTGIQADNARYAVVDGSNRPGVLVVTDTGALDRDAFYVQQALEVEPVEPLATADRAAYRAVGVSPSQLSSWDGARVSAHVAVVLLSTRGLERRGREAIAAAVKNGVGLFIAAGPSVDGDVVRDVLGRESPLRLASTESAALTRTLAAGDVRHPIFQAFQNAGGSLGLVSFRKTARIDGTGCQSVARFVSGESALIECLAGLGRALVFASDLDNRWNDFPLHASFVPFLQEAVRYVGNAPSRAVDYLVGDVPASVPAVPGIASLPDAGSGGTRLVAVNVDPRESDPARLTMDEFRKTVARLKGTGSDARPNLVVAEDRQQLWRYALMLMVGVLALEGYIASRTS